MNIRAHIYFLAILLFVSGQENICQQYIRPNTLKSNFAKDENKEKYYANLVKNVNQTLNSEYNNNSSAWIKALRDAQSINLQNNIVADGLKKVLNLPVDQNKKLQRVALEVASDFKEIFKTEILAIFTNTTDKISYSITSCYLASIKSNTINLINELETRYPNYSKDPILSELHYYLSNKDEDKSLSNSEIKEILNHDFQVGKTIVYTFQRNNRNYPGITIIKKPNGEFVKNKDGAMFSIPQLALSYSNLPGFIPNGNTPQGIYSIIGWYISPTKTIGPTPNILVRSPFEVSPSIFFHGNNKNRKWNMEDYKSLIPSSWIKKKSIYQSYKAGKSGRRLIIMHGSTDEIKYYEKEAFYPLTPTRGCLSSKEIWSGKTGKSEDSDQIKLINAFRSTKQKKGFLVVIELDDKEKNITLEEILPFL